MGSPVGLVTPPSPLAQGARAHDVVVRPRPLPGTAGSNESAGAARTGALVFAGAWLAMLGGLLWWTCLPVLVGWEPRVVLTGSMMPGIAPGDVVLMAPAPDPLALPPGRIVVVADPTRPAGNYSHRIVRHEGDRLVTKGDANQSEDFPAIDPSVVLGEIRMVVPRVGLPVVWLRAGQYLPVLLALACTWLALVAVLHGRHPVLAYRASVARAPAQPLEDQQ